VEGPVQTEFVCDVVVFKLAGGRDWLRLLDTNLPDADDDLEDAVRFTLGDEDDVTARSILLCLLRPERQWILSGAKVRRTSQWRVMWTSIPKPC
jgi:hypothetical protein